MHRPDLPGRRHRQVVAQPRQRDVPDAGPVPGRRAGISVQRGDVQHRHAGAADHAGRPAADVRRRVLGAEPFHGRLRHGRGGARLPGDEPADQPADGPGGGAVLRLLVHLLHRLPPNPHRRPLRAAVLGGRLRLPAGPRREPVVAAGRSRPGGRRPDCPHTGRDDGGANGHRAAAGPHREDLPQEAHHPGLRTAGGRGRERGAVLSPGNARLRDHATVRQVAAGPGRAGHAPPARPGPGGLSLRDGRDADGAEGLHRLRSPGNGVPGHWRRLLVDARAEDAHCLCGPERGRPGRGWRRQRRPLPLPAAGPALHRLPDHRGAYGGHVGRCVAREETSPPAGAPDHRHGVRCVRRGIQRPAAAPQCDVLQLPQPHAAVLRRDPPRPARRAVARG